MQAHIISKPSSPVPIISSHNDDADTSQHLKKNPLFTGFGQPSDRTEAHISLEGSNPVVDSVVLYTVNDNVNHADCTAGDSAPLSEQFLAPFHQLSANTIISSRCATISTPYDSDYSQHVPASCERDEVAEVASSTLVFQVIC
jgi:hypothetical protein